MFGEQLEQKDEEHRKELKKAIAEKDRTIEELRKEIERLKNV
jgi:uncharacterized protein YjgD (DUF1641 family)